MLTDREWKLKYTREDGDLVQLFYVPALEDAERYDRLTGYFDAKALALTARGVEGLVRNDGRMRLVAGCTLDADHIAAIERGADLRERVARRLAELPLAPPDAEAEGALALLAWMVARGRLDVKVAVPCGADRKPVRDAAIFHAKTGIVADRAGNRLAWTGSLNETAAGWTRNWESISVYTSWGPEPARAEGEEADFARLWANRAAGALVIDAPEAARRDLLRFLPPGGAAPARLTRAKPRAPRPPEPPQPPEPPAPQPPPMPDRRARLWAAIAAAPRRARGGARVGEATAAVAPWPHQVRAFERLYAAWPPRLLIADEVGLGKTVQAGMLLRQAWLAGRAKRILILAPRAILPQWQAELREKFNLDWPIYDGARLVFAPAPGRGGRRREIDGAGWRDRPAVLASSQTMRRSARRAELLAAEPWDLAVLDEAHHARRRAAGSAKDGGPNALLQTMQALEARGQCRGLVLLTATPMQVHPVELRDLLALLGLPPEWSEAAFLRFFDDIAHPNPGAEAFERMAGLFRAAERAWGRMDGAEARRVTGCSRFAAGKVLRALRDSSSIPRRRLETPERRAALAAMRARTPVRALVSRHTRDLLRRYFAAGAISTPVATRRVEDRFVTMTADERALYRAVEDYISAAWNGAAAAERSAVGFVMTIYRRRLASSFRALRATLERHLAALDADGATIGPADVGPADAGPGEEDLPDDELLDAEDAAERERRALAAADRAAVAELLERVRALPPDGKLARLKAALAELRRDGHDRAMVFTQFADTMDFLRDALRADGGGWRPICYSGRGGEEPAPGGGWRAIARHDAARRFERGEADLLLCTDAAAEGLNFQFCGALVDYDMPWNPMRVEQRIGRIDRLGQKHPVIRVVNLHYEGTVETDVYRALRTRIRLFESVVGRLQPILARLPGAISDAVLRGADAAEEIARSAREAVEGAGFDLDSVLDADLAMPARAPSALAMADLDRLLARPDLMPPGVEVQPMGPREYGLRAPGMSAPVRVTTDRDYHAANADSVEFWSPGNPLFRPPDPAPPPDAAAGKTAREILEEG